MQLEETETFRLPNVAAPFVAIGRIASSEGLPERNRPHYHPDTVEICAVVRGQLDWFVAEETYVVHPGEVLVVPANVVHGAIDSNLQPCEIVAVHLAPDRLPSSLSRQFATVAAKRMRAPSMSARVLEILAAHRRSGPYLGEVVAALGTLLAADVVEFEPDEQERNESWLIRQAQQYLMSHGGQRPTIDDVAHRLGVSSVWLHKLFVRETGASPGDWSRAKRLTEAKRRLIENQESNVKIALDLGYSSGQAFATAFRKESGMTPSEYRELHAEGGSGARRTVYRVDMRETWIGGVRVFPPD